MKQAAKEAEEEVETSLEEEVQDIVDSEEVEENDMLRNRPHNAHRDDPAAAKFNESEEDSVEEEEDFETTESVKFNENGDIELEDDDVIDESTMKRWCLQSIEVR